MVAGLFNHLASYKYRPTQTGMATMAENPLARFNACPPEEVPDEVKGLVTEIFENCRPKYPAASQFFAVLESCGGNVSGLFRNFETYARTHFQSVRIAPYMIFADFTEAVASHNYFKTGEEFARAVQNSITLEEMPNSVEVVSRRRVTRAANLLADVLLHLLLTGRPQDKVPEHGT
jgi:hypothetical protein